MKRLFSNLQNSLINIMIGRNGPDALARTALWVGIILTLFETFTGFDIFSILGLICLAYAMFRCFSRNISKRAHENARFVTLTAKPRAAWNRFKDRWDQRKTTRFLKCPQCGQSLSVPKGKGALRVTCPKCRNRFDAKS